MAGDDELDEPARDDGDLGHGVHTYERDGVTWIEHACSDGMTTAVPMDPASHQTSNYRGLTVRPALTCDACGLHGEVTDGDWVPLEVET